MKKETKLTTKILKVGITGGVGSGKSHLLKAYAQKGIPTYEADVRAKALYHEDLELKNWLLNMFGNSVFDKNNELNKSYLSQIVFNSPEKLKLLNEQVHPRTIQDFSNWVEKQNFEAEIFQKSKIKFVIKEAALIFEAKVEKELDHIIYVYAPLEIRISRVQKRDNSSREEILTRISRQLPDDYKMARSHQIFRNYESTNFKPQSLDEVINETIKKLQQNTK